METSVLIIGLGRFGKHLAIDMLEMGNDVMIVDRRASSVDELAPRFTNAQIGDCTNPDVLRSIGVGNFDVCFVAIGDDFQSSLEITSQLKEMGAKRVISRARRDIQAKFLLRNGADEVVYPERDIAERLAIKYTSNNIFDYVELTLEYGMYELQVRKDWVGKTIRELDVRRRFNVNILGVKKGKVLDPMPDGDYAFEKGDHLMVLCRYSDVQSLTGR